MSEVRRSPLGTSTLVLTRPWPPRVGDTGLRVGKTCWGASRRYSKFWKYLVLLSTLYPSRPPFTFSWQNVQKNRIKGHILHWFYSWTHVHQIIPSPSFSNPSHFDPSFSSVMSVPENSTKPKLSLSVWFNTIFIYLKWNFRLTDPNNFLVSEVVVIQTQDHNVINRTRLISNAKIFYFHERGDGVRSGVWQQRVVPRTHGPWIVVIGRGKNTVDGFNTYILLNSGDGLCYLM